MKGFSRVTMLAFFLLALNSFAKNQTQGIYLGGGLGLGTISCINCDANHHTVTHTLSAHNITLGYQFNRYIGLELNTSVLQSFAYGSILTPSLTETPYSQELDLAIKGILPLSQRINLFGKLGDGVIWLPNRKDENTAFSRQSMYYAAGVMLQATPKVSGGISYHHYAADHLVINSGMLEVSILF